MKTRSSPRCSAGWRRSRRATLSAGLAKHPGAFDGVFVSLVNTGEVSGTLDKIMDQTATYLERAETLRLKVQAALRYPIFVLSFASLILIAMVVKIIPMFATIYERFRVPLPLPTQILLAISKAVVGNLGLPHRARAAHLGTDVYLQRRPLLWLDRVKRLPLFGPLIRSMLLRRFRAL
jgi:type IV pilus assembly protein PilC